MDRDGTTEKTVRSFVRSGRFIHGISSALHALVGRRIRGTGLGMENEMEWSGSGIIMFVLITLSSISLSLSILVNGMA